MMNHMTMKKSPFKEQPFSNIPTTILKSISFPYEEHKEANNKYNELLGEQEIHSIFMDLVDNNWIIEYEVYTKGWLKKYGK
jgi:hypothetical protein